jgi:hypothetical protein
MIASPSDVTEKRKICVQEMASWNSRNSEFQKICFISTGHDINAAPDSGKHPQEILNKKILKSADILICIFGNRVGSPTEKHTSGTIEEYREHTKTGKRTLVYFSGEPAPRKIDPDEIKKMNDFKESIKNECLYYEYSDENDFKKKLSEHLDQVAKELPQKTPEKEADALSRTSSQHAAFFENQNEYSDDAYSDIDFRTHDSEIKEMLEDLDSGDFAKQNSAIKSISLILQNKSVDSRNISSNEIFVLGRRIYRSAREEGRGNGSYEAQDFLRNFRNRISSFSEENSLHLLNGIFYEIYFDEKGVFRIKRSKGEVIEVPALKEDFVRTFFEIQSIERYAPSVSFIREKLEKYKNDLLVLPDNPPETFVLTIELSRTEDSSENFNIVSIKYKENELIRNSSGVRDNYWRIFFGSSISLDSLLSEIQKRWGIPKQQVVFKTICSNKDIDMKSIETRRMGFRDYESACIINPLDKSAL